MSGWYESWRTLVSLLVCAGSSASLSLLSASSTICFDLKLQLNCVARNQHEIGTIRFSRLLRVSQSQYKSLSLRYPGYIIDFTLGSGCQRWPPCPEPNSDFDLHKPKRHIIDGYRPMSLLIIIRAVFVQLSSNGALRFILR